MHTQLIPICNICKWYSDIFENYGWIMLAKRDNVDYRIQNYRNEINDIIHSINEAIEFTESKDKVLELKIMLANLEYLNSIIEIKETRPGKITRGGMVWI